MTVDANSECGPPCNGAIGSADQLSEFVSVGGAAEKAQERDVVHVGEPLGVRPRRSQRLERICDEGTVNETPLGSLVPDWTYATAMPSNLNMWYAR